jgi:hypothetical protein
MSSSTFLTDLYTISVGTDKKSAVVKIDGRRLGPPSKRIALNQKGLRVNNAQIVYHQKNKEIEHSVVRINHLPSFEEVRLHTSSPLYPGRYQISVEFSPFHYEKFKKIEGADLSEESLREFLPSFDNEEARQNAKIELV